MLVARGPGRTQRSLRGACFSQTGADVLAVKQLTSAWAVTPDGGCARWGCSLWGDNPYGHLLGGDQGRCSAPWGPGRPTSESHPAPDVRGVMRRDLP